MNISPSVEETVITTGSHSDQEGGEGGEGGITVAVNMTGMVSYLNGCLH